MFNASSSRGSRRDADASVDYETDWRDLTMDRAIYPAADGRSATHQAVNISVKKRRVDPSELPDEYRDWEPVPDTGDSFGAGEGDDDDDTNNVIGEDEDPITGEKRKRYLQLRESSSQSAPVNEGLGDAVGDVACGCCPRAPPAEEAARPKPKRIFRCSDCGMFLQCEDCVLTRHGLQPLHLLKEWTGEYWEELTLQSLGLVYQMGHGGLPCPSPDEPSRSMVVIHPNGIHVVSFRYCKCDLSDRAVNISQLLRSAWYPATTVDPATCATFEALELYRLLNVVGNINVHNFVGTLERLTGSDQDQKSPAFGRMSRQYAFLKRAKRAGRGHDVRGLRKTPPGGCAVLCWACPQDGINLPEGWRDVAPEFRQVFLYMLLLAVDANFRLKNRIRKNEVDDPSFGSGWGHLVEEKPYRKHLKGYVAEKDISTCIAFAALLQKDTRMTTGLRCSGVGGVKGERYSNMDYIVLSSIIGLTLLWLTISYDIACQWQINLAARMEKMPEALKLGSEVEIQYGLPVWHAAAHETECQVKNSLNYLEGVGRTDGEGIERTWSGLNPAGWATKEMGKGARHDSLEDRIDHHNWEKNIRQGDTLARKLVVAIGERDTQVAAFTDVDSTLRSELRKDWQAKIDTWIADRSKPSPYETAGGRKSGPSEVAVRLQLKKEEMAEAAEGAAGVHRKGATAFLVAGMQLEETQRRIKAELKGRRVVVADASTRVEELRMSFIAKLETFRSLQAKHMPGGILALEQAEEDRDADSDPPNPEDVVLWMPSELANSPRARGCVKGLAEKEVRLREAQCTNALDSVRDLLHSKRHLIQYRNSHLVGQTQSTRSNTLIGQVTDRTEGVTIRYRRAWKALGNLKGAAWLEKKRLRELTPADIKLDEEEESDARARHRLGKIGSAHKRHRNEPTISSKKRTFSWIWTARGGPGEDEEELHDCVRVDWSKALARKNRWVEEVRLLREEMRRVLRFLVWKARWWESQRRARGEQIPAELAAGLDAYAARQAALHRGIAARFKAGWDTSAAGVVRAAAREDALLEESMAWFERATEEVDGVGTE
ncbi:hypothetical protein DFH09DRAFT_1301519 [Mycena vulgaris]|nr:hypothetical protein DFH09DRAFT_1301519 [Mycena vulgaris]